MTSVFLSYASPDRQLAQALRASLKANGIPCWLDENQLRGGDLLSSEIKQAIDRADAFLVLISANTANARWVPLEIESALATQAARPGYAVVPLLLAPMTVTALKLWFPVEPKAVHFLPDQVDLTVAHIREALRLSPLRPESDPIPPQSPLEELELRFSRPDMSRSKAKPRARAELTLVYRPSDTGAGEIQSVPFTFQAPLGAVEMSGLRWYLERYYQWPVGVFKERASETELQLPRWGRDLFRASLGKPQAAKVLAAWQASQGERRISILLDPEPPAKSKKADAYRQASCALFTLPWELLRDENRYLFRGAERVRVRRRLPNHQNLPAAPSKGTIHVLLVSPRPEDESAGYIDHRASARPLLEAVASLGSLVEVTLLDPPTFPALKAALSQAKREGKAYHVLHFDGHGIYHPEHGLGQLCFEEPADSHKLEKRRSKLVDATNLAEDLADFRLPLVFLEACQSAQAETDVSGSVAAALLKGGVSSVVAMSYSVLVETARRFVGPFYAALARGERIGSAMLAGQHALLDDDYRCAVMGAGELRLQDWFVPVLYQESGDPALFETAANPALSQQLEEVRARQERHLPKPEAHGFQGRSRELLLLERLLQQQNHATIVGIGGAGKTSIAVELARWLLLTRRFEAVAFVCLEGISDARAVLDALGRQLVGENYSVAHYSQSQEALYPLRQALSERKTLLVMDNLESVLPAPGEASNPEQEAMIAELLALWQALAGEAKLLFTSRETLPPPFTANTVRLGALAHNDAIALLASVLEQAKLSPHAADLGDRDEALKQLVESVNGHARALVLLAPDLARRGVKGTIAALAEILAAMPAGEREKSLFASVALSLKRLPSNLRQQIQPLALFHGGASLVVMARVLELEVEETRKLAVALIAVGLGRDMGDGHLQLDPALPLFLDRELQEPQRTAASSRWLESMQSLTEFLFQQWFKDATMSARLSALELPNLLAMLERLSATATAEQVVDVAYSLETLFLNLGWARALTRVVRVLQDAAARLGTWSHAAFQSQASQIERLLEGGDYPKALTQAQKLLASCQAFGEGAYAEAAYDLAMASALLGRVLMMGGAAENALGFLEQARLGFKALAVVGDTDAERMATNCLAERADCLSNLGRLDEAAADYETAIKLDQQKQRKRSVAASKGQLGTVRMRQKRLPEALKLYGEAREIFEALGEPSSVATAWHQIGMAYEENGQYDAAESAYRQSLAIEVKQKNRSGEASSLGQLGLLFERIGRLEQAVTLYSQAAELYVTLGDLAGEGRNRNNLADLLIQMKNYDQARRELKRAITCYEPYGHSVEHWKTWVILCNLERAVGQELAASEARQRACDAFLAYRRQGGENHTGEAQLCADVGQWLSQGDTAQVSEVLDQLENDPGRSAAFKLLLHKLRALLAGERDLSLADDPELTFDGAVELQLLLEHLRAAGR